MISCNRLLSLFSLFLLSCTFAFTTSFAVANPPAPQHDSGVVLQSMNVSDYTYMLVKTATDNTWVAIPATEVKEGAEVTFLTGMVMTDFYSSTLERTFETLVFSPGLVTEKPQQQPDTVEAAETKTSGSSSSFSAAVEAETRRAAEPQNESAVSAGSAGATVPFVELDIDKAAGENSYTIGEIFSQADSLAGRKIQVRGKVVKMSPGIMGRNWIHLQDGTGDPMRNSHDLVVTSQDAPEEGEVVVAEGEVTVDRDFGYGYEYDVLVENASVGK